MHQTLALLLTLLIVGEFTVSAQDKDNGEETGRQSASARVLETSAAKKPAVVLPRVADEGFIAVKKDLSSQNTAPAGFPLDGPGDDAKYDAKPRSTGNDDVLPPRPGFDWSAATKQSLVFLGVQQGFALMTQAKTRDALRGPFFRDYARSVKSLHGWGDGGRLFTNYIAHPMQGAFLGFIQVQNDPRGKGQTFGRSGRYWQSRLKALAWSAAWSTQFEIGPISQASIGNVGLNGKQTYVDIVLTPTAGLGMLVAEDAVDRYLVRKIEMRFGNFYLKIFARMIFNPTRTMANILGLKTPWFREPALR